MILKSFGCSFIFGSELSDDGKNGLYATGSCLTWPALLSQYYNYGYCTYSRPGSGNLQIAERVLNELDNQEENLYVIGWTWIDRFDYINESNTEWPGSAWATLMPQDNKDLSQTYYKNLHSEYQDKLTTLINIKLVIDTLKQKNLPFIMTYMDDLIFDQHWHTTPAVLKMQDYIRPYLTTFDGMSFLEWSRHQQYPETKQGHPLEAAHAAAARYMLELGVHKV